MIEQDKQREQMVVEQIRGRGVSDSLVLQAMGKVKREAFVPKAFHEFAYADRPLPIASGQTISQPYIVAYMIEALALHGGEKILEVGAGSGYAAAVLAELGGSVFAIERDEALATLSEAQLRRQGYDNVQVLHADGTLGWMDHAPFDAILVSAGAPEVPDTLKAQLAIGGRMVIPVGSDQHVQELILIKRAGEDEFITEDLADVRFVPLIGEQGWELDEPAPETTRARVIRSSTGRERTLPDLIKHHGESFNSVEDAQLDPLLHRIGDARVVLIGEASHGTSEFYTMRARITRRLIEEKGFAIVAAEADWPDAAHIDQYVRHREVPRSSWEAFARFPTWMWRNEETREFIDWLHEFNLSRPHAARTAFYGLDLYSLYSSARAVIKYLDDVDPQLAKVARYRYGCLSPWESDPAAYGHAALTGAYRQCEQAVADVLLQLQGKRMNYAQNDGERFLDASQNAQLIADAERYYRTMYYGSRASWNLRDQHMFRTLGNVLQFHGSDSRAVVWAHNSHIGDATATEMSARGEHNIGQLCRQAPTINSYHIGLGTDHGTVAAASEWDGPMEVKTVQPAHAQSYERVFHESELPGLILPLTVGSNPELVAELVKPRLERAIGVIYRPQTELASHYFEATLSQQFDEYIWIDETSATSPLPAGKLEGMPDTYPFGI